MKGALDNGLVLTLTGLRLRGLGRLSEARGCLQAGRARIVESAKKDGNDAAKAMREAAKAGRHLSRLDLILGNVQSAVAWANDAVERGRDPDECTQPRDAKSRYALMAALCALAAARHQSGDPTSAQKNYQEAERVLKGGKSQRQRLHNLQGYRFCDLLLDLGEKHAAQQRAAEALEWANEDGWALAQALYRLTLGRAELLAALEGDTRAQAKAVPHLDEALSVLRSGAHQDELPPCLLVRSRLYLFTGDLAEARAALNEAMDIAARDPQGHMKLFVTDCHLGYARLALAEGKPDDTREHVDKAKALIEETGYHRRDAELAELKAKVESA